MSGSGIAPGITMTGASPGCQRSMFSGEPSAEPKNRFDVLNAKASRGGAGLTAVAGAEGALLRSSSGSVSNDSDTSYCGSGEVYCGNGGALSASSSSGSSGALSAAGGRLALFMPITDAFDVEGS